MFNTAPSELLVIAVVALVVIGPKDLPKAMHFVGKWVGKARKVSRHFRSGLDTMMREAELEELEREWRKKNAEIMRLHPMESLSPGPSLPGAASASAEPAAPAGEEMGAVPLGFGIQPNVPSAAPHTVPDDPPAKADP